MKVTDISFYNNIPGISVSEHRYWRKHFEKILKLGVELEYNLKIYKGECEGINLNCKCDFLNECTPIPCCFLRDANTCSIYFKAPYKCKYINTDKCVGMCHECVLAEPAMCNSTHCISYQPICIECDNNTVICNVCKEYVHNIVNPNSIRHDMSTELEATNNFGYVGKNGVLQVVKDGSLKNGGLEIPTVGRRYDFETFRNMLSTIMNKAKEIGGYIDKRCSVHVHILNEYYTKISNDEGRNRHPDSNVCMNLTGIERPFPNIIMYNLLQIWRKYESAIFWMSMGLSDANSMTRWSKFRYPISKFNPLSGFDRLLDSIAEETGNNKYAAINIRNSLFNGDRFHIEVRTMDFVNSPTYISAMCGMFEAIVMRAIDISMFGVMDIDSNRDTVTELTHVLNIANGHQKGYDSDRLATTENVIFNKDFYIKRSHELLNFLAPTIKYEMPILRAIADKPPALHLIGASCEDPQNEFDIESVYSKYININTDAIYDYIYSVVALCNINGCKSEKDWVEEMYGEYAADHIKNKDELHKYVHNMVEKGMLVWDTALNTYRQNI